MSHFKFYSANYLKHFIFIRNRKTTYATLLEMLMAAYKMVNRLKEQSIMQFLNKHICLS